MKLPGSTEFTAQNLRGWDGVGQEAWNLAQANKMVDGPNAQTNKMVDSSFAQSAADGYGPEIDAPPSKVGEFLKLMGGASSSTQPAWEQPYPGQATAKAIESVADPGQGKNFLEQTFVSEVGTKRMYLRFEPSSSRDYDFRVLAALTSADLPADSDKLSEHVNFRYSFIVGTLDQDNPDKMRLRLGSGYLKTDFRFSPTEFFWVENLGPSKDHPEVDVRVKRTPQGMEFTLPKGWLDDEQGGIPQPLVFRAPL